MKRMSVFVLAMLAPVAAVLAQGAAGIDAASSEIATYFDPVENLHFTLAAVVALVGGTIVFIRWKSKSTNNVPGEIMGWIGGCVFAMLIGVFVRAVFGI